MRSRTRFIATLVCIVLPVIALSTYLCMDQLAYMDDESPYYYWNREMTNTAHDEYYRTIILGDSGANAAFEPALLSADTLNLALGGTTPMENYYTLQEWLENNPAPKVCYISFGDSHMQKEDCFWKRVMYMHRYRLSTNIEMMKAAIKYNEKSVLEDKLVNDYIWDFTAYELWAPSKYVTSLVNSKGNGRKEVNQKSYELCELHSGRYISRSVSENKSDKEVIYDSFSVGPLFDHYYRKLIELCLQNGIEVHIVKLPISDLVSYSDGYVEDFNKYYDALMEEYQGITVEWIKYLDKKCYTDLVHMNYHGSLRFCAEIKRRHSDDFADDTVTPRQILAVNDALKIENKLSEILRWVDDRDYTVVLCDVDGGFI